MDARTDIFSTALCRYFLCFLAALAFWLGMSCQVQAQAFSRDYPAFLPPGAFLRQLVDFPDGNFLAAGTWINNQNQRQLLLVKFDPHGDTMWTRAYDWDVQAVNFEYLSAGPREKAVVCGSLTDSLGVALTRTAFSFQVDSIGDSLHLLNLDSLPFGSRFFHSSVNAGGGRIFGGSRTGGGAFFTRTLPNGDTVWTRSLLTLANGDSNLFSRRISQHPNGQFATLLASNPSNPIHWRLLRLDSNGDTIGSKLLPSNFTPQNLAPTADGAWLVTGQLDPPNNCPANEVQARAAVFRLDSLGDSTGIFRVSDCIPSGNLVPRRFQYTLSMAEGEDGSLLVQGFRISNLFVIPQTTFDTATTSPFILKLDSSGSDSISLHEFAYDGKSDATIATHDGGLLFFGEKIDPGSLFNITRLYPSAPETNNNANITGKVFWDRNSDCQDNDPRIPRPVLLRAMPGYHLTLSDSNGRYNFTLPQGIYNIQLHDSLPYLEQACSFGNPGYQVNLFDSLQAEDLDMALQTSISCPLLSIDIGTAFLAPCSTSTYNVQYSNAGSDTAFNSFVDLEFDPDMAVQSASIPWQSQVGQLYSFPTGDLPPGASSSFTVDVLLDCNSLPSQMHCVDANIFPDTLCFQPDSNWNGAFLTAEAECNATNDTATITFKNQGAAALNSGGLVLVLEDNVMKTSFQWQPNAGQDTTLQFPSSGRTWYIRARQPAGFPLSTYAIDLLEGCGLDSTGQFTTGLAGTLPTMDWDYFRARDCQQSYTALSSREKLGIPIGWGADQYIEAGDDLTYTIRFQNTGVDTAVNVLVSDTLSDRLDPASIQFLSASHTAQHAIDGNGILNVYFPEILLPDSASDPIGSRAYAKFRIGQAPGNLPGECIENTAALHFDISGPLYTNTAVRTIFQDVIGLVAVEESVLQSAGLAVYPNPFTDQLWFELKNVNPKYLEFELFDLQGRLVDHQTIHGVNKFEVRPETLAPGIYLFRLQADGSSIATGKLIRK